MHSYCAASLPVSSVWSLSCCHAVLGRLCTAMLTQKVLRMVLFYMGFWMMHTGCRGPETAAGKRQEQRRAAAGGVDQSTEEQ